jgi:octaheme c-type cytochrome (tetrathionate reductase family)
MDKQKEMNTRKGNWLPGLVAIVALIALPVWYFTRTAESSVDTPWDNVPRRAAHVDHASLFDNFGEFTSGREVTVACLGCHADAGQQMLKTAHWRWESDPVEVEGREGLYTTGKKKSINNFCIGIQGNWASCTACHAGYGWEDENFDFADETLVDCLVCHDQSGVYTKGKAGLPVEGVDLLLAAQSVGVPTRQNCGGCHFRGGGGNAVKHGDLDQSLYYPTEGVDVHMGRFDFQCVDCHRTTDHVIGGRSTTVSLDNANQIACRDCHDPQLHADDRINAHTDTVACQTCHIPEIAVRQATKTHWDWSTAGDDTREEDTHEYLKIKGSFIYQKNLQPEYRWFNGLAHRYLMGDAVNADGVTAMNAPRGDVRDPDARIWPFKIHRARQPYDTEYGYLLQPVTSGEGGFWQEFDWDQALRLSEEVSGRAYSGNYDFAATEMYWPSTHMVAIKERALQCQACHSDNGRLDWQALGYDGDPITYGSQARKRVLAASQGAGDE